MLQLVLKILGFPENGGLGDHGGDDVRVHVRCRPSVFKIACAQHGREGTFKNEWVNSGDVDVWRDRENRSPFPSLSVSRPTRMDAPRFATPWTSSKPVKEVISLLSVHRDRWIEKEGKELRLFALPIGPNLPKRTCWCPRSHDGPSVSSRCPLRRQRCDACGGIPASRSPSWSRRGRRLPS